MTTTEKSEINLK